MEENKKEEKEGTIVKEKTLFERHTNSENKVNITTLINEIEAKLKTHTEAIKQLTEAMGYLAHWVEEQDSKKKIILPENQGIIGATNL